MCVGHMAVCVSTCMFFILAPGICSSGVIPSAEIGGMPSRLPKGPARGRPHSMRECSRQTGATYTTCVALSLSRSRLPRGGLYCNPGPIRTTTFVAPRPPALRPPPCMCDDARVELLGPRVTRPRPTSHQRLTPLAGRRNMERRAATGGGGRSRGTCPAPRRTPPYTQPRGSEGRATLSLGQKSRVTLPSMMMLCWGRTMWYVLTGWSVLGLVQGLNRLQRGSTRTLPAIYISISV